MCFDSVCKDPDSLKYVPEEFKTYVFFLYAIKNICSLIYLSDVPQSFRNYELCLEAVKRKASALKYVPDILKTKKRILEIHQE